VAYKPVDGTLPTPYHKLHRLIQSTGKLLAHKDRGLYSFDALRVTIFFGLY